MAFEIDALDINSGGDQLTFKVSLLPDLKFLIDIDLNNMYIFGMEFIRVYNLRENEHVKFGIDEAKSENPLFNCFLNLVNRFIQPVKVNESLM